jgi:chromosomal replication initiation ATPase DnaA
MSIMRQLALPFVLGSRFEADFLAAPSNETARRYLEGDPADWPHQRLFLWGPPATGKTHLLHRWTARRPGAVFIEAAAVAHIAADGILPGRAGLAIDDIDQVPRDDALLHVLNIAAERRVPVLLAARESPGRSAFALPDLASRLRATLTAPIAPPEEELLDALLARLLAERQLAVSPAVIRYLRLRLPREPAAMREAAARLDAASLAAHRPVTVPLAASLFDEASSNRHSATGDDLG